MNVPVRWPGRVPAEVNGIDQKCIRSSENAANIVHAADVFEQQDHRQLGGFVKLRFVFPMKFLHTKFSHNAKISRDKG